MQSWRASPVWNARQSTGMETLTGVVEERGMMYRPLSLNGAGTALGANKVEFSCER